MILFNDRLQAHAAAQCWAVPCYQFEFISRKGDIASFRALREQSHSDSYLCFSAKVVLVLRVLPYEHWWRDDTTCPFCSLCVAQHLLGVTTLRLPVRGIVSSPFESKGTTFRKHLPETCHPASFASHASLLPNVFWGTQRLLIRWKRIHNANGYLPWKGVWLLCFGMHIIWVNRKYFQHGVTTSEDIIRTHLTN